MIKVAIANDTIIALEALRRVISTDPTYELIWTARNGAEAVAKCQSDLPDLLLMDLLMPGMDGVEATRQIMARWQDVPRGASPCAILIVTASVHGNTSRVFEAMGHGALDVVRTPVLGPLMGFPADGTIPSEAAAPLLAKMATVASFMGKSVRTTGPDTGGDARRQAATELIVLGASTGGPKALSKILGQLPTNCHKAIVVVQHIDGLFAAGLAEWLDQQTPLPVTLAQTGEMPAPGKVLVAQAHHHLVMKGDRTLAYLSPKAALKATSSMGSGSAKTGRSQATSTHAYCPSVDVFFKSVAKHWHRPGKAALLTGMGQDGAEGLSALRAAGWLTIAESEQSCVVYGMPRAAVELGAVSEVLAVEAIARALMRKPRGAFSVRHRSVVT